MGAVGAIGGIIEALDGLIKRICSLAGIAGAFGWGAFLPRYIEGSSKGYELSINRRLMDDMVTVWIVSAKKSGETRWGLC